MGKRNERAKSTPAGALAVQPDPDKAWKTKLWATHGRWKWPARFLVVAYFAIPSMGGVVAMAGGIVLLHKSCGTSAAATASPAPVAVSSAIAPPAMPPSAVTASASSPASSATVQADGGHVSPVSVSNSPSLLSSKPRLATLTYDNHGINNGIIGPNGTMINAAPPARRVLGRTVEAPMVQRLTARNVAGVTINACGNDPETKQLADDFWNMAVQLKWDVRSKPNGVWSPEVHHGVIIDSTARSGDLADPLLALKEWLASTGIPADYRPGSGGNEINVWPQ